MRAATTLGRRLRSTVAADLQPRVASQCMRQAGLMPIRVVEHILPPALQTHELCFMPPNSSEDAGSVLITQMEEGRLLRVVVNAEGSLSSVMDSATFEPEGSVTASRGGLPFVGLHGLAPSSRPGKAWVTLQYINEICLIDVHTLAVEVSISCPRNLEDGRGPIGGPHSVRESGGKLFVCMKGGASICHGDDPTDADQANTHALWRVSLTDDLTAADAGTVFEAPPTPVMCDVTADGDCWVACDATPTLFRVPADAMSTNDCVYHQLPYQYATLRQTGPGITVGPDGRPWFCILNGNGVVGRVSCCGHVQLFELFKSFNPSQRLCHLSWDANGVLYAISSDLLDKAALNTLIRVKFDASFTHVVAQHEIAFPSQHTCVHRVLHLDGGDHPSVLVSELSKSQCLQIFKQGLPPLEQFPMKTFEITTRKVYDANEPCPRSGNPLCHCAGDMGATIPAENIWADPRAEDIYDPAVTPSIAELTPVTDPRTGEEQLLHDFSTGTRVDSAFNQFWSFGIKGFTPDQVPAASMYSTNGNGDAAAAAQPAGKLGASTDVLRYKPEYLRKLLEREPWRKPQLLEELRAAGLLDDLRREAAPKSSDR